MTLTGIGHPGRYAAIAAAVTVAAIAAVVSGVLDMRALGHETVSTGLRIGVGGVVGFFGLLATANFVWAVRRASAIRRGEGAFARWTVPPETLARFRAQEASRDVPNDFGVPKRIPPDGLEIVVTQEAAVASGAFFGLGKAGLMGFTSIALVPGDPSVLVWGTRLTSVSGGTAFVVRTLKGELRLPVASAAMADAARIVAHYQGVLAGRIVVSRGRWRIRLGLSVAAIGALIAAASLVVDDDQFGPDLDPASWLLLAIGAIFFTAGAAVALAGWVMARNDRAAGR